jgi:hypothetical protein
MYCSYRMILSLTFLTKTIALSKIFSSCCIYVIDGCIDKINRICLIKTENKNIAVVPLRLKGKELAVGGALESPGLINLGKMIRSFCLIS